MPLLLKGHHFFLSSNDLFMENSKPNQMIDACHHKAATDVGIGSLFGNFVYPPTQTPTLRHIYVYIYYIYAYISPRWFKWLTSNSTCFCVLGSNPRWIGHLTLFAKTKIKRIQLLRALCSVCRHNSMRVDEGRQGGNLLAKKMKARTVAGRG